MLRREILPWALLRLTLGMAPGRQIAMLAVLPLLAMPRCVPMWARLFDGGPVVRDRARQGGVLVLAVAIFCAGTRADLEWAMWVGAVVLGVADAGANLGWSLGHDDFASPGRAQHSMDVYVTLTGLRGMVAPPLGIAAYQGQETLAVGAGRWSVLLPRAGTAAGAAGFTRMRRRLDAARPTHSNRPEG